MKYMLDNKFYSQEAINYHRELATNPKVGTPTNEVYAHADLYHKMIEHNRKIEKSLTKETVIRFTFGGWGTFVSLSDDGTLVYYKVKGMGLTCSSTFVDNILKTGP